MTSSISGSETQAGPQPVFTSLRLLVIPPRNRVMHAARVTPRQSAYAEPVSMEDAMANLSGACSCGAVKYRLTAAPMFVHCCHCRDCQRQTGSAFVLNALIEANRVQILQGDTRSFS